MSTTIRWRGGLGPLLHRTRLSDDDSTNAHENSRLSSNRARLTLVGALALAALFLAVGVYAFWSSAGTGSAAASTATLGAPSITGTTPGAGTVALTWSAATPPGAGAVTYSVARDGGDAGGTCPTAGSPAAVTSCTDSGLAAGTYTYTVTARWWSWTATSTTSTVTVVSGAATQLVLAAATTTPVSGAADALTITARDAGNNTVASYHGRQEPHVLRARARSAPSSPP